MKRRSSSRRLEKATDAERAAYLDVACCRRPRAPPPRRAPAACRRTVGGALLDPTQTEHAIDPDPFGGDRPQARPIAEEAGSRIGPYLLTRRIGEGGMGVVFLAEQEEPVRRKVALKVIKPGWTSAQVVARFEAERQALALMDHPNIARVLDAGTTEPAGPSS